MLRSSRLQLRTSGRDDNAPSCGKLYYIILDIQHFKFNFQVSTMFKRRDFNGNRKTEVARGNNKAPTFQEFVLNLVR